MKKIAIKTIGVLTTICSLYGCAMTPGNSDYGPSPYKYGKLPGWQKPYIVRGQSYTPLNDHEGFYQEGLASWYGEDFHGKLTSNGETYDMYDMTAAHKTLPIGVYVKVQNRLNGRDTVVRINDRGPFVGDRIIDMSYAGAKALGMVDRGVSPVSIEALGFRGTPQKESRTYSVQVGAFSSLPNAEAKAAEIRSRNYSPEIKTVTLNGEKIYRVLVGRFEYPNDAEEFSKTWHAPSVLTVW